MQRITIRPQVFETNSSSMHSIAIRKKFKSPTEEERRKIVAPYIVEGDLINLADYMPEEYGKSGYVLDNFITKLCYVVSAMFNVRNGMYNRPAYQVDDLIKAIGVPEVQGFLFSTDAEDEDDEEEGYEGEVFYDIFDSIGWNSLATIDHQSVDMIYDSLPYYWEGVGNDEWINAMRRLLFDPECFILIDGDWGALSNQYDSLMRL